MTAGKHTPLPSPPPAGDDDRDQVSALARGLQLLDCFRSAERFLSSQELVERSGLPKATVSRLVHTLTAHGYLDFSSRHGKYHLGARVLSLGFSMLGGLGVRQVARPFMRELAEQSSASVSIGARDGRIMVYVENCASTANQNFRLTIGSRVPLATSAMGRAYFCGLDGTEREQLLRELSNRHPAEFRSMRTALESGLRSYEKLGFCHSIGEWQDDVNAVGVPYRPTDGTAVLGFNCCGPAYALPRDVLIEQWGPRLVNLVRNVEAATAPL